MWSRRAEDGGLSLLPSSEEFIQGTLHADDDDAEAALQQAQQKQHIQQQEARAHLLRDRQQFPGSPVVSVAHATAAAPMPASQSVAPIQAPVVPRPLPLRASSCDLGCFCGDTHAPEMRVQLPMHARTKSGCEKKLSQAQRQAVMVQQRIQQQQALNPKKRQRYDLGSPASAVLPTAHAVPLIPNASGAGQLVPDRTGNGGGGYCYRPHAHPVHGHMQHGHPQEGHVLCRHPPAGMAPHGRLPSGHIQHMHMQSPQYDLGSPTTAVLQGRGPAHRGPREQHYLVHGGTAGDGQDVHELMASRDVSNGYPDGLRPTSAPPERRAAQTAYVPDGTPYAYVPRTARAYSCGMMPPGESAPPGFPSAQRPGGPSGARPMLPTVQALPCDDGQVLQHGTQQRRPQHPQLVSLRQPHRQQQQNYQWYDAHSQSPQYTQHRQQPQPCYDDGSPIPASYPNSPHFAPTGPPLTSEPLMEPLMPCAVTHLPPSLSGGTPLHPHRSQLPPPLRGRTPSSNGSRGMSSGEGPSLPPFTQAADGRCLPPPALARQGSSAMSGDSGGGADADSGGGVPHVQSCGDPAGQRPDASAAAAPQAHPSAETASPDGPEADESGGGGPSTEETVSSLVDRFINNRRRRHCTIDAHLDEVREILSQADPVKFAVWGIELEHADGGPGPEIMQELGAEIELTPEQLAALASHREAIYAERDALMRCHQLLQKTRQQVHLHTQSFSHVMGELRNILSPVQVRRPSHTRPETIAKCDSRPHVCTFTSRPQVVASLISCRAKGFNGSSSFPQHAHSCPSLSTRLLRAVPGPGLAHRGRQVVPLLPSLPSKRPCIAYGVTPVRALGVRRWRASLYGSSATRMRWTR